MASVIPWVYLSPHIHHCLTETLNRFDNFIAKLLPAKSSFLLPIITSFFTPVFSTPRSILGNTVPQSSEASELPLISVQ